MSNDMVGAAARVDDRGMYVSSLIVPLAAGVLLLKESGHRLDAPWSASGTGTTNVASDRDAGGVRFEYSVNGDQGAWQLSAVARSHREAPVVWCYGGFHAWYRLRVNFERFVRRGGAEVVCETLARAGAADSSPEPSGGFLYGGTSTFELRPGDVYGFRMSGGDLT